MKKVIFKTLKTKNFLSIGETPVVINFQKGLNIITGINRDLMDRQNAIGKTSILDSFYFSLFGETSRELKKEFISNNITNEGAEVSLTFSVDDIDYEIQRSIKPSKLILLENGNDVSRDSMANTTEHIMSLLNLTPEIFSNCISLSINSTIPFMGQKKVDKKKFIEGIFNLDIFSKMNSSLKSEYSQIKKDIESKIERKDDLSKTIDLINDQSKRNIEERDKRKKHVDDNIVRIEKQISELSEKIKNYQTLNNSDYLEKIKKLENKKSDKNNQLQEEIKDLSKNTTEKKILQDNLSKIGTDSDECPVCLRNITEHDTEHISKRKKQIENEITNCATNVENITIKINEFKKDIDLFDKTVNLLNNNINKNNLLTQQKNNDVDKLKIITNQLLLEKKTLLDLENFKSEEIKNTNDLMEKLNSYEIELNDLIKHFKILESVKFVLSEEGVKSYVVKKILNLFNSKISHYLRELHSNAIITFDQYFEEEIKNERGKPTMYFNYSGAERKAIDLAVMFAFTDMLKMQTNVHYNVQFYDELLDTSLDSAGVENVIKILNEFVDTNSYGIYIISHRKECSKLATGEVVYLEKSSGITKRIQVES
jgi:DNA repair exonuclease SbcCD ATPase subunit